MASDFDKLFGDDWPPQDFDGEGGPASLRGRGSEGGDSGNPREGGSFGPFMSFSENGEPNGYTTENENRAPRSLNEKEVKVMGVFMHEQQKMPPQHFVLLRDNKGRRAPIWVGQFEAWAISYALDGDQPERPMTHDLFKLMLDRIGATIERVIIDDLWHDTFYAKIGLVKPDGEALEIDARPSDAIALALRSRSPIYMAEFVLEAAAPSE